MNDKIDHGSIRPSLAAWKSNPPFRFNFGGRSSLEFLSGWQQSEEVSAGADGQTHLIRFTDPKTLLTVTSEVRTFASHDAIEWVLRFANKGSGETPLIEDIQPLHWGIEAGEKNCELGYALGSEVAVNDFENRGVPLWNGGAHRLASMGGRSSRNYLPFFDLLVGYEGIIGAIGWTGNWAATFTRDWQGQITLEAGMHRTRLKLHAGEEIRTPRILLLNYKGDRGMGHNAWRRLLLAHYVPQKDGKPVTVPAFCLSWGTRRTEDHLAKARDLFEAKVPMEVYWIDAGWYGDQPWVENATVFNTQWWANRGSWRPSKECYPDGFKAMSDELKKMGMGFLLWLEPEVADKGSDLLTAHPDWFLLSDWIAVLNLGNPEARKGITDLISGIVTDSGLAWYRQDFNMDPERAWNAADSPDRIGMTEIRYIEGLYEFWDELRARHPDLMIDNCSSGGRRIDLETISRSIPLWRSDYQCNPTFDSVGSQFHTAGLAPWVPLTAGVVTAADNYQLRSAYSAGLLVEAGACAPRDIPNEWLRKALEEFKEIRPYFHGDFYPIKPHDYFDAAWVAWQYHRPDLAEGVGIYLRRKHFPEAKFEAKLGALDPAAQYSVEIRTGLDHSAPQVLSGEELSKLTFPISEQPGSAILIYKKLP